MKKLKFDKDGRIGKLKDDASDFLNTRVGGSENKTGISWGLVLLLGFAVYAIIRLTMSIAYFLN